MKMLPADNEKAVNKDNIGMKQKTQINMDMRKGKQIKDFPEIKHKKKGKQNMTNNNIVLKRSDALGQFGLKLSDLHWPKLA